MSDYPINESRFRSKPDCIKKWFAENAVYDHPDLISIPLGLENHTGKSKGIFTDHEWFEDNVEKLKEIPKNIILYCNWNNNTNKERSLIINQLRKTNVDFYIENRLTFKEYCNQMTRYKFVVCPPGNGIDTHRIWEALYLGCYPIVIKNRIYRDYDLPIIQIDNYSEITLELLGKFIKKHNFKMIYMSFWRNKIIKEFKEL